MNILHAGDELPMQKSYFKNSLGNLLPTLRLLSGLYLTFVILQLYFL